MREGARFLLDENIRLSVAAGLRRRAIDTLHVRELDMLAASDLAVLEAAIRDGRIVATRDLRDFARLAGAYLAKGRAFPGILILSSSFSSADAGSVVHALEDWVEEQWQGEPIPGGIAWVGAVDRDRDGASGVREQVPAYAVALERLATLQNR